MQEHDEPLIETGIPCFRCGAQSGVECPGRKPGEATLCEPCFKKHMVEAAEKQAKHQASFLEGVRSGSGARELWNLLGAEEREGIRKILGDAAIERILIERRHDEQAGTEDVSRQGAIMAAVKVMDALNEMLDAVGGEETVRCEEKHANNAMGRYSGVGCPDCGLDADVEGDHVEIDGASVRQEVTCSECGRTWANRYQFMHAVRH